MTIYKSINKKMKRIKDFYQNFTALVWKEDKWYVARCLEIEVASQGRTKKEAVSNLKEALTLYLENEPTKIKPPTFDKISLEKITLNYA